MFRWLLALFYCPIVPLLLVNACPDLQMARGLGVTALVSGFIVARIHWKQASGRAQGAVLLGYLLSCGMGFALWPMGLLALAFASDSGEHAQLIFRLMIGLTVLLVLFAPVAGAAAASQLMSKKKP